MIVLPRRLRPTQIEAREVDAFALLCLFPHMSPMYLLVLKEGQK